MALPTLPYRGQNPWYTERTNWDNAVEAELEGRLSNSGITALSQARSALSVSDFGAIGDGTTDDTAAIQAAVTAAQGATLFWPDKSYRTFSSIDNLHNVRHIGSGRILADGSTFRVSPVRGQTNILRVSPTGSDTNDGLSTLRPMREVKRAVEAIANYSYPLGGSWRVQGTAGTYRGGIDFNLIGRGAQQDDFIRIIGPTVTHPTSPTMIIDYDSDPSQSFGMRAYDNIYVMVTNVKFQGGFGYAIDARRGSYLYLDNVHGTGPGRTVTGSIFFGALDYVNYYMLGGIIDGYERGIQEHGQVRRHFENVSSHAAGTQIKNCQTGLFAKEGCGGHLDYIQISDCDCGIMFHTNCNANTLQVMLKRNTVGMFMSSSEIHNETSMVYGSGTDANGRTLVSVGPSTELAYLGWTGTNEATMNTGQRPLALLSSNYTSTVHTGTTTETTRYTFPNRLKRGMYAVQGKRFEVRMVGSVTTSPSTATGVRVLVRVESQFTAEVTIPQGAPVGADFEIVFTILCTADGNNQKCWATLRGLNNSGLTAYAARTLPLGPEAERTVNVSMISGAEADSVTFQVCELWG